MMNLYGDLANTTLGFEPRSRGVWAAAFISFFEWVKSAMNPSQVGAEILMSILKLSALLYVPTVVPCHPCFTSSLPTFYEQQTLRTRIQMEAINKSMFLCLPNEISFPSSTYLHTYICTYAESYVHMYVDTSNFQFRSFGDTKMKDSIKMPKIFRYRFEYAF
jgi:hypothetical protein